MRPHLATLALLLTPPGLPSGGFHWQRTVTPPPGAPTAQACVLLDAATFANAAPALRDLRLFQDGFELPYAIEESYDPRALESGETPADDRSFYEPVLVINLLPRSSGVIAGDGLPRKSRTHALLKPGEIDTWLGLYNNVELAPHVPVERLRFEPAPDSPTQFQVIATENDSARHPAPTELLAGTVDASHPTAPLTLGANLQHSASLFVATEHGPQPLTRAILEMRRRSLCYQPRSASPLTLYLGGGPGMAAKTYSYASTFSTALDRPYATLGPLTPNPDDATDAPHPPPGLRQRRLLWAAALAAAFFAFSASRMLRQAQRP